jgi:hypothetical protein
VLDEKEMTLANNKTKTENDDLNKKHKQVKKGGGDKKVQTVKSSTVKQIVPAMKYPLASSFLKSDSEKLKLSGKPPNPDVTTKNEKKASDAKSWSRVECFLIFIKMAVILSHLKVITYNITAKDNLGGLYDILVIEKPDIVLLQEVHVSTDELSTVLQNYNNKTVVNNDMTDDKSRGTAIVWRVGVEVSRVNTLELSRLQSVDFGPLTFFNVYAPSGQNNRTQTPWF